MAGADAGSGTIPFARANWARLDEANDNPRFRLNVCLREHCDIEVLGLDLP